MKYRNSSDVIRKLLRIVEAQDKLLMSYRTMRAPAIATLDALDKKHEAVAAAKKWLEDLPC